MLSSNAQSRNTQKMLDGSLFCHPTSSLQSQTGQRGDKMFLLLKSNNYYKLRETLQKFTAVYSFAVKFGIDIFVHWAIVEVQFQYLSLKFDRVL